MGLVKTYSEALEKLIVEKLIPNAAPEPWQSFRDTELWTIDVNDILEANLENLKKIFAVFFSAVKKFVTFEDVLNLFMRMCPLDLNEKDLQFCFSMSKMAVTSEPASYKNYNIM